MRRTLLIVDDISMNREILRKILGDEYDILEAGDGVEALALMRRNYGSISAVLLDLAMPVMDGFGALEIMSADPELSHLPVIVTTGRTELESEVRALELGANDYITKPYNSAIIKQRIKNTINLRETAATVNLLQRDRLTGLYQREIFFEKARELILSRKAGYFVMSAFDVENFKVINDQYGAKKGDMLLKHIADCCARSLLTADGLACRVSSDHFAVLYPSASMHSSAIEEFYREALNPPCLDRPVSIRTGRYVIDDVSIPVSAMYDRAAIAENSVRGRYEDNIATYDESMRERILHEQTIVNEMRGALSGGQFEVWFQPQFNHSSRALIGAEALVRWRHPERGLVSPADFIPVFERNGFIYELDKYVWEQSCMLLRKWLDEGRAPLPVSVNISRSELLREDLVSVVSSLAEKYGLPTGLLRLEITESAFAGANERVIDVVEDLTDKGFTIEIDDFGSGYSSLNTLKDVPADIIKLDMRFLENGRNSERGGNILESIIRMARWLGMPVIAEGVETVDQAEFLKSIGCYYIQGYLYSRPMPASEYEDYARNYSKEQTLESLESLDMMNGDAFWDPGSLDTLIFNSFIGGACVFEYENGKLELLRINKNYVRELGLGMLSSSEAFSLSLERYMNESDRELLLSTIKAAIENDEEASCEICLRGLIGDDSLSYIRSTLRVIAKAGEHFLLYCTIENVSALREAERHEREACEQISAQQRTLLENLPCGAALFEYDGEALTARHLNKRYFELVGRETNEPDKASVLEAVHPDDRERLLTEIKNSVASERDCICNVRLRYGVSGEEYRDFRVYGRAASERAGVYSIYTALLRLSIEHEQRQILSRLILSSIMDSTPDLSFAKDKDLRYLCASRPFVRMVNMEHEGDLVGKTDYELFDKETADKYRGDDLRLFEKGESLIDMIEEIPSDDGVQHHSYTSKYLLRDGSGEILGMYGVGRDITEYHSAFEQLKLLNESIPGGIASFELSEHGLRNIYFNEGFYSFTGYTRDEYRRLLEADPFSLIFKEDLPPLQEGLKAVLRGERTEGGFNCRYYLKDGGYRWMNIKGVLSESHKNPLVINMIKVDITDRKLMEEQLRMSEEQYRLAMEQSGMIMCRFDVEDMSINMTPEVADIFGLTQKVRGVPYASVRLGRIGTESTDAYIDFYESIMNGAKRSSAEFQCLTTRGWRWLKANQSSIFNDEGEPVYAVISFVDNTERHMREEEHAQLLQNERKLQEAAETDGLTKLLNRKGAEAKMKKRIAESSEGGCSLLIVDMDDLKRINDTFGHPEGDRAIKLLAECLGTHFRRSDVIGRVGGDEFIVLLDGLSDVNRIREMLLLLIERVSQCFVGDRSDLSLCISVGASVSEDGKTTFEELYSQADGALYRAKRSGKRQFAFYSKELD